MPVSIKEANVLITVNKPKKEIIELIFAAKVDSNVFKDGLEARPIIIPVKVLLNGISWLLPRSIDKKHRGHFALRR